jgi:hypothetical protein
VTERQPLSTFTPSEHAACCARPAAGRGARRKPPAVAPNLAILGRAAGSMSSCSGSELEESCSSEESELLHDWPPRGASAARGARAARRRQGAAAAWAGARPPGGAPPPAPPAAAPHARPAIAPPPHRGRPIPAENVGFRMLKKMEWEEGLPLGPAAPPPAAATSAEEPAHSVFRRDLGFAGAAARAPASGGRRRSSTWRSARGGTARARREGRTPHRRRRGRARPCARRRRRGRRRRAPRRRARPWPRPAARRPRPRPPRLRGRFNAPCSSSFSLFTWPRASRWS